MNSLGRYRAILFDFEGTLVDFQWNMQEALQEALAVLSLFGFDKDLFHECNYATLFNTAMEESRRLKLPPERIREEIEDVYDRFDMDALTRWTPKSDARNVLETVTKRSLLTGLVTNAGQKSVSVLLRRFRLDELLNVTVTRNDVRRLKPNGDGIWQALEALGVDKRETLFVGDSVTDIMAVKEVGMDIAVVLGGESREEDIRALNPLFVIRSLSRVLHFTQRAIIRI